MINCLFFIEEGILCLFVLINVLEVILNWFVMIFIFDKVDVCFVIVFLVLFFFGKL